ncbi:MAG: BrnT family toxin [Treponematales bacterium]|jgi:uncharacterized DUF497 family protein
MDIRWNEAKNRVLKAQRGVSFEEAAAIIRADKTVDILEHPNKERYGNQRLLLVNIDGYIFVVPAVIAGDVCFLKTMYPSRKYTKRYLGGRNEQS